MCHPALIGRGRGVKTLPVQPVPHRPRPGEPGAGTAGSEDAGDRHRQVTGEQRQGPGLLGDGRDVAGVRRQPDAHGVAEPERVVVVPRPFHLVDGQVRPVRELVRDQRAHHRSGQPAVRVGFGHRDSQRHR